MARWVHTGFSFPLGLILGGVACVVMSKLHVVLPYVHILIRQHTARFSLTATNTSATPQLSITRGLFRQQLSLLQLLLVQTPIRQE